MNRAEGISPGADSLYPPSLRERVDFLLDPAHYPEGTGTVQLVETHFACVFLTDHHVYKLKKPLRYPEVDLSTLPARVASCREEVRLNRPLAPGVYLGTVFLNLGDAGALVLDGGHRIIDCLVKMRRLPSRDSLKARLREGRYDAQVLEAAAHRLMDFYEAMPAEGRLDPVAVKLAIDDRAREIAGLLVEPEASALRDALFSWLEKHHDRLADRRRREVHGDLRPEHVFPGPEPVFIDRLEFNRTLRVMDPLEELAFLLLECLRLGDGAPGRLFLRVYAERMEDRVDRTLLQFHVARRALNWALLSARHLSRGMDPGTWTERTRTYLRLGEQALSGLLPLEINS